MNSDKPFPFFLAKPAQRALANAGITSLEQLSKLSDQELSALHGMGPNALAKIREALAASRSDRKK